ncbi:MAG: hypothetical protein A3B91_02045 [Candidatus Yanofskybacteria bacterium RIFCSPHIGHO2_02_FULL_41_29]|uniref:DUF8128 domain-containing protein n=1 Tax=Candidatus Yanofskybacteria bacterium RIFCSPHIGHO2_01_FULL_41_53 TaxID=1802663 RepID=A0A1F8EF74_9BACT|nr:MAG: hypothetical protein A2650_01325 [Candidatus Yanofskybacteria bacterium RIFCSPHIGHO2_01_FULL_41_53]OGN10514.1 MAG: hypothetical protein A3B91_02045 [Candidatus Yanofskybacteria bacterium RIFCSPHIGHO2_02_FULL_41_29]OGN18910.1 MAG: hypothetical protein A3F48_02615 [Candidatus Yanofskybacteria bacterium RIFCSPHIGHO2_12_FULL_41_9]OGN21501.1 MAG: hypothetical protein A2916_01675 [Candidatus Yanofskybacteria bacterium RIFCSPLOWO2_01_FULL_41_67]OGN28475.1 MAG: hypothetical protein A3H54_04395 
MDSLLLILNSFKTVFSLLLSFWWVYLPILLFYIAYFSLLNYTSLKYRLSLEWVLLEVLIPKEVRKSPKAMEQVFAGLHGVYAIPVRWHQTVFKGKVPDWFSFEMVGRAGETHFYIRTFSKYRNLVESQIYAQYPTAEVIEAVDYINDTPHFLPDDKYDLWGGEMMLSKPDAYPIRTYPEFEEKSSSPEDVKRIDPMASLSELFSTLHPGEQIWIQILASPTGDGWIKKGQLEIDKIMGKIPSKKGDFLSDMVFSIDKAISSIGSDPEAIVKREEKKERVELSPGKHEILKAIEKSFDKLGYETGIRFLYIGPKDAFHQAHVAGVVGAFRQYSSQNLNSFKMNKYTLTFARGLFKASKLLTKKVAIFQSYKERKLYTMGFVRYALNTEELATIYHFPDVGVRSPLLPRVEAKKGEPPTGLPIM